MSPLALLQEHAQRLLGAPLDPAHRLYLPYMLGAALVGALLYLRRERSLRGLLPWLLPRRIWAHPSTRTDAKLLVTNALFGPATLLASATAAAWLALQIAQAVGPHLPWRPNLPWGPSTTVAFTLSIFLLRDFSHWLNHWLHHRVPLLWPLHSVHHSAPVLSPLTLYRKHPLYDVVKRPLEVVIVGLGEAIVLLGFGTIEHLWTVAGVNVFYAVFLAAGSNLRHSHIWWDWGWLDHLFISPAQHQVHHSTAPEHRDRNFGSVLAIWDWLFGTLYVPDGPEELTLGIPGVAPHDGLLDAWLRPLREIGRIVRRAPRS